MVALQACEDGGLKAILGEKTYEWNPGDSDIKYGGM